MKVTIDTETGSATLNTTTGGMFLDNSGYYRLLTKEQVQAAWNGEDKLPHSPEDLAEFESDDLSPEDIADCQTVFDGKYWDFGEELHIIPDEEDFA